MRTGLRHRQARGGANGQRGVALLMVLVGIALLGLVANEVRYNSLVEMRLATNQRDAVRAHFLAKGGIGISRMVLMFQKQIDSIQLPNIGGMMSMLQSFMGGGAAAGSALNPAQLLAGAGAGGAGAPQSLSIQLWRMAKIDCHMLAAMVPEEDPKRPGIAPPSRSKKFEFDDEMPELGTKQAQRKFGDFTGCFTSTITDEEERINLNRLDAPQLSAQVLLAQLAATLGDKKYEFLFEKEDTNRIKVSPSDVIIAMRDWIDEDEQGSALNLTGQGEPFQKGFSDENGNYSRYDTRYKAKNGRFDSLDELFMIHGVNDKFMAAFKDRFTVYPDVNSRLNINTDDPMLLELAIRSIADPSKPDIRLADPIFIDTLIQKIRQARIFALFGMSALDFVNVIAAAGVVVNPTIMNNVQNQRFIGDKSTTYRIQVQGQAGDVTKTLTTVVRLDNGLGRLVYWREE